MKHTALLTILAVLATLLAGAATPGNDATRKKARYYYMEGLRHNAAGENAEAYEYFRKAYTVDTTYEEAANAFGSKRLLINIDTLQSHDEVSRSLELMRRYVDRYPGDIFESSVYAYVAAKTDTAGESVRVFRRTAELNPGKTALWVHLADSYMSAGEVDSALVALDTYERLEGKSPQLTIKKLTCFLAAKDTLGAISEVTSLVDSYPTNAEYVMLKGNLFEALSMPDSTMYYYRHAEELDPDNGAIKMALADYYQQTGDSVAYDNALYDALLSEDFGLEDKLQVLAEYLQTLLNDKSDTQRGDYLFGALEKQYPHAPQVLDLSARYNAAKGDLGHAIEQIGYAIDLEPEDMTYRGQLMSYLLSADRPREAIEAYHKTVSQLGSPNEGIRLLYASACGMAGEADKARDVYAALIDSVAPDAYTGARIDNPGLLRSLSYEQLTRVSALYNMMGDSYYTEGDKEKAFEAYENSLYFLADNPMTLNNYAYFLAESDGDLERAAEMSREALAQVPDNDTYLDTYAWIEFKLGHYDEARQYQEKAIEIAEANGLLSAELLEHYGDILFMCKQPSVALDYWKRALELDPDNALLRKKVEHRTYYYPENHN